MYAVLYNVHDVVCYMDSVNHGIILVVYLYSLMLFWKKKKAANVDICCSNYVCISVLFGCFLLLMILCTVG